MKPLSQRVEAAVAERPAVGTPREAYNHVLWVLQRELESYQKAIWDKRVSSVRYTELRSEHKRLKEDIEIVEALQGLYEGRRRVEKPIPTMRHPEKGYGEI